MLTAKNQKRENESLLIKGGHLIDPATKINTPMDILLRDGRVAEVAPPNKIRAVPMKSSTRAASSSHPASSICTSTCASPAKATKKPLPAAPPPLLPVGLPPSAPCPIPRPWLILQNG